MQNFCITHEEAPRKVKTLRNQCAVVILTLILAVSAFAGHIQSPGIASGTSGTSTSTDTGTTLLEDTTTTTIVIVTVISVIP